MTAETLDFETATAQVESIVDEWGSCYCDREYNRARLHYDPGFRSAVVGELDHLATLQPNWDGYGAPQINPRTIDAAKALVNSLPENIVKRPKVVPMSSGNLQFEWHEDSKTLELEFESSQRIHYLKWHPEAETRQEDVIFATDVDAVVALIKWFMGGVKDA